MTVQGAACGHETELDTNGVLQTRRAEQCTAMPHSHWHQASAKLKYPLFASPYRSRASVSTSRATTAIAKTRVHGEVVYVLYGLLGWSKWCCGRGAIVSPDVMLPTHVGWLGMRLRRSVTQREVLHGCAMLNAMLAGSPEGESADEMPIVGSAILA